MQDGGVRADPDILAQDDRGGISHLAFLRFNEVVQCGKHDIMSYLAAVTDCYAAVILKMAAGVDEYAFSYMDVLSEVRVERREDPECVRHLVAEQLGQHCPDFTGCTVGGVQPERDTPSLSTHSVHKLMYLFRVKRFACFHEILEFLKCHNRFPFLLFVIVQR